MTLSNYPDNTTFITLILQFFQRQNDIPPKMLCVECDAHIYETEGAGNRILNETD